MRGMLFCLGFFALKTVTTIHKEIQMINQHLQAPVYNGSSNGGKKKTKNKKKPQQTTEPGTWSRKTCKERERERDRSGWFVTTQRLGWFTQSMGRGSGKGRGVTLINPAWKVRSGERERERRRDGTCLRVWSHRVERAKWKSPLPPTQKLLHPKKYLSH